MKKTIIPTPLKKGDTVAIISIARKITSEEIAPAVALLEKWGLKAHVGNTIDNEYNQLSGTTKERVQDFQEQLNNPIIKAIWFARGGYGSVHIIDHIDFSTFIQNPKWLIGYSDITVIHNHVNQKLNTDTLHATMSINLEKNTTEAITTLKNALFGFPYSITISKHESDKLGTGTGELVGGNLSIIYSLLGSESALKTNGKILFIEDLDEYLYHIDRMLMNLKRNELFYNLKGLIVGGMTQMNDNTIPWGKTVTEMILEHTQEYNFPICFDFPAGHIDDNRALIFNKIVTLKVEGQKTTLNYE